jgi:hypothetical protein
VKLPRFFGKKRGHRRTGLAVWGSVGEGLFYAALVAAGPTAAVWGVAGLEAGAAALALTGALLAATARPGPRAVVVGLCVGALAWLRPETCAASAFLSR